MVVTVAAPAAALQRLAGAKKDGGGEACWAPVGNKLVGWATDGTARAQRTRLLLGTWWMGWRALSADR
eukprot:8954243-Alexandrium_andersonii.AAC.1